MSIVDKQLVDDDVISACGQHVKFCVLSKVLQKILTLRSAFSINFGEPQRNLQLKMLPSKDQERTKKGKRISTISGP